MTMSHQETKAFPDFCLKQDTYIWIIFKSPIIIKEARVFMMELQEGAGYFLPCLQWCTSPLMLCDVRIYLMLSSVDGIKLFRDQQ